jgi:hypothetical protein
VKDSDEYLAEEILWCEKWELDFSWLAWSLLIKLRMDSQTEAPNIVHNCGLQIKLEVIPPFPAPE